MIPLNALARIGTVAESEAVSQVLQSGCLVLGPNVEAFEREFALYCRTTHCVGVASGTDALELALRAVGVAAGTEVVMAPNAGGYTMTAASAIGARPSFADVDPQTHVVNLESVRNAVTSNTRAIVVTHLYGLLAPETEAIVGWATSTGISVVEDCAQAAGASRGGRFAGTFGAAGAFSFYPTKNLGAVGDAGAVITSDGRIATETRSRRQYGWTARYLFGTPGGLNSRLDELQAAVLRVRLPRLDGLNEARRGILRRYADAIPAQVGIISTVTDPDHVAHLAVATLAVDRDAFRAFMHTRGVMTDVHYPTPDYRQPVLQADRSEAEWRRRCPHAEWLSSRIVTLPCFPEMSEDEVTRVCRALSHSASLTEK